MKIHPTACIDPRAELDDDVEIGPYCVIGGGVALGKEVRLISHVSISGNTKIAEKTVIHPFSALGEPPQDLKYKGKKRILEVGANNVIREHVTLHPGIKGTRIGDNGLFMVGAHVGHDCHVGNSVTMTNHATLGGNCYIEDNVILGGLCALHQGIRVAHHAFVSGCAPLGGDVIPFGVVNRDGWLYGLNIIGMKRAGFSQEEILPLRQAYQRVFKGEGASIAERARNLLAEGADTSLVTEMLEFVLDKSRARRLCTLKGR